MCLCIGGVVLQIMAWVKWGRSVEGAHMSWKGKGRPQNQAPLFPPQCKAEAWDCPSVSPYVPGHRYKAVYSSSHWVNYIILGTFLFPWTSQCSAWGKVTHTTHSTVLRLIAQSRPWRKRTQETFIFLQNWYSTGRVCTIMLHLLPFSCYLPLGDPAGAEVT